MRRWLNTRMIIKRLFELFTIFFLVKVYWVDCYLRSNAQKKELVDKERKLDRRDFNFEYKDDYNVKLDDFYDASDEGDDDNHEYYSQYSHEGTYDDHYPEDNRHWHQNEHNDENPHHPSKYDDDYMHDDYNYNPKRLHEDDFEKNQLDADSYSHGSSEDDWTESAKNRLNDYNTYIDDDAYIVAS